MTGEVSVRAGLVGRRDEVGLLRTALCRLLDGRGGGVWIEGGPGLGKTELVGAVTGRRGISAPVPAVPLGALRACLEHAALDRPDLYGAVGLLVPDAPHDLGPFVRKIRQACRARPLLLVLDDLHRADDLSLAAWSRLHQIARTMPLLLVTTTRPVLRPALDAVHALAIARGATVVNLAPLGDGEATRLAYALGHHRHVVEAAVHDAAGNPSYLRLLGGGRAEPPTGLRVLIAEHLSILSERSRWAVTRLAVTPPDATAIDLADGSGRALADIRADLAEAQHAAILTSSGGIVGFRHPIVRRVLRGVSRGRAGRPARSSIRAQPRQP